MSCSDSVGRTRSASDDPTRILMSKYYYIHDAEAQANPAFPQWLDSIVGTVLCPTCECVLPAATQKGVDVVLKPDVDPNDIGVLSRCSNVSINLVSDKMAELFSSLSPDCRVGRVRLDGATDSLARVFTLVWPRDYWIRVYNTDTSAGEWTCPRCDSVRDRWNARDAFYLKSIDVGSKQVITSCIGTHVCVSEDILERYPCFTEQRIRRRAIELR